MAKLPKTVYVKQDSVDDNDILLASEECNEHEFLDGDMVGEYQLVGVRKVHITTELVPA